MLTLCCLAPEYRVLQTRGSPFDMVWSLTEMGTDWGRTPPLAFQSHIFHSCKMKNLLERVTLIYLIVSGKILSNVPFYITKHLPTSQSQLTHLILKYCNLQHSGVFRKGSLPAFAIQSWIMLVIGNYFSSTLWVQLLQLSHNYCNYGCKDCCSELFSVAPFCSTRNICLFKWSPPAQMSFCSSFSDFIPFH